MKEIQLTQGKVALVDDEDFDFLNQWKWTAHKRGNTYYAVRALNIGYKKQKLLHMHRVIMVPPDNKSIDHINHSGIDNRRVNLRIVTHRENNLNRRKNASLAGVYKLKSGNYYLARIRINGLIKYLGCFHTAELAHEAYMKEFELLNNA